MILELFYQPAYRLHNTLAMKLTHSRLCAALAAARIERLLYVQVDRRVLRRPLHITKKQADEEGENTIMDLEVGDLGHTDENEVGGVAYTMRIPPTVIRIPPYCEYAAFNSFPYEHGQIHIYLRVVLW